MAGNSSGKERILFCRYVVSESYCTSLPFCAVCLVIQCGSNVLVCGSNHAVLV